MERRVIWTARELVAGDYEPGPGEAPAQCAWVWNKETGKVVDFTETTRVVVGYANTLEEALAQ